MAGALRQTKAGFLVATIAAIFMTVTEGLGTGVVPLWTRLAYWLIVMETGAVIGAGVTAGVQIWAGLRHRPIIEVLVIGVLIALPLTLAVIGAGIVLLGMERPSLANAARNFALVAFISVIITAITYAVGRARSDPPPVGPLEPFEPLQRPSEETAATAPRADSRFRARLPLHLQDARIVALVSEDHYLRVRCDGGDALILMRLSDAIAEIGNENGAQTHRSWWVARGAVARSQRGDGKGVLTLTDGTDVPVSRTHYRRLVNEGWFA